MDIQKAKELLYQLNNQLQTHPQEIITVSIGTLREIKNIRTEIRQLFLASRDRFTLYLANSIAPLKPENEVEKNLLLTPHSITHFLGLQHLNTTEGCGLVGLANHYRNQAQPACLSTKKVQHKLESALLCYLLTLTFIAIINHHLSNNFGSENASSPQDREIYQIINQSSTLLTTKILELAKEVPNHQEWVDSTLHAVIFAYHSISYRGGAGQPLSGHSFTENYLTFLTENEDELKRYKSSWGALTIITSSTAQRTDIDSPKETILQTEEVEEHKADSEEALTIAGATFDTWKRNPINTKDSTSSKSYPPATQPACATVLAPSPDWIGWSEEEEKHAPTAL